MMTPSACPGQRELLNCQDSNFKVMKSQSHSDWCWLSSLIQSFIHYKVYLLLLIALSSRSAIALEIISHPNAQHTCALTPNHLKCWGVNTHGILGIGGGGQIGDEPGEMGAALKSVILSPSNPAADIIQVALGPGNTCVLFNTNKVKCWGYNDEGQLGLGDTMNRGDQESHMGDALPFIDLGSNAGVPVQISIGHQHMCAVFSTNAIKCWGKNQLQQLGYGHTTSLGNNPGEMGNALPTVDLGANFTAIKVWCRGDYSCAYSEEGTMKCWGQPPGISRTIDSFGAGFVPTQIVFGHIHACALSTTKTLKCFGTNWYGQAGYGDTTERNTPASAGLVDLGSDWNISFIQGGNGRTCAVSTTGKVKCWGRNIQGLLGYEDKEDRGDNPGEMGNNLPEIDLGNSFDVVQLQSADGHACAVSSSDEVKCWGKNNYGQLGQESTVWAGTGDEPDTMGDFLPFTNLGFTKNPTRFPSTNPSVNPTEAPTVDPTTEPTADPTTDPTTEPTTEPTQDPTIDPTMDPTMDPTSDPTIDPTMDPTSDPTMDPTTEPTQDPTMDPTIDPTQDPSMDPTLDPTIYPTTDPTQDPTTDPTTDPTIDPTLDPTNDPTIDPTSDPTSDPTTDPTTEPTQDPTLDPTNDPTIDPTVNPSLDPTTDPTTAPSLTPTLAPHSLIDAIRMNVQNEESDRSDIYIYCVLFGVPIVLVIFVFIMQSTLLKDKLLSVDRIKYVSVALYFIQLADLYSDAMFAIQLYAYYSWANSTAYDITTQEVNTFHVLFVSSLIFTIVPYVANFVSSVRIVASIASDPIVSSYSKEWFKFNSGNYSIGVLLSGGSYYTLKLINSNFLGLPQLSAGLSVKQIERFAPHKVWFNTLLENLPQMIIQFYFVSVLQLVTTIAVISMILSLFNILLTVLSTLVRRASFGFEKEFPFTIGLSVAERDINGKNPYRNAGKIQKLTDVFKSLSQANRFNVEIMSFSPIEGTLYGVVLYTDAEIDDIKTFLDNNAANAIIAAFSWHDNHTFSVQCYYPFLDTLQVTVESNRTEGNKKETAAPFTGLQSDSEGRSGPDNDNIAVNVDVEVTAADADGEVALPDSAGGPQTKEYLLLKEWNLSQYWDTFVDLGYDDYKYWKQMVSNADNLKEIFGDKRGHKERFVFHIQEME